MDNERIRRESFIDNYIRLSLNTIMPEYYKLDAEGDDRVSQEIKKVILNFRNQDKICKYHTLNHTCSVVTNIQTLLFTPTYDGRLDDEDIAIVRLAAIFHDYKYVPLRKNNEEIAALEATDFLFSIFGDALSESIYKEIEDLILATKHDSMQNDIMAALLCDADILNMGMLDFEEFQKESDLIEEEILGTLLKNSDDKNEVALLNIELSYVKGRKTFLQETFLDRKKIFHLINESNQLEKIARTNLTREIEILEKRELEILNQIQQEKLLYGDYEEEFGEDEPRDRILLGDYFWNEDSDENNSMPDFIEVERWNESQGLVEKVKYKKV